MLTEVGRATLQTEFNQAKDPLTQRRGSHAHDTQHKPHFLNRHLRLRHPNHLSPLKKSFQGSNADFVSYFFDGALNSSVYDGPEGYNTPGDLKTDPFQTFFPDKPLSSNKQDELTSMGDTHRMDEFMQKSKAKKAFQTPKQTKMLSQALI